MKFRQILVLALTAFLMSTLLATLAFGSSKTSDTGFLDIPSDSACYEAVTFLAENGITVGTGNQCYSPDDLITVRQWATMLCRTYAQEEILPELSEDLGDAYVLYCYRQGWLAETAVIAPDSRMCRSALLQSALLAADITFYNYELYPGGQKLSGYDNTLRVARELGLCSQENSAYDLMTRDDVAKVLYLILNNEYEVEAPPMASAVFLCNKEGVNLNSYLMELQRIPETIRQAFEYKGWAYVIDFAYLKDFSEQCGMNCIGVTSYSTKQIYVSDYTATIHEFGHFLGQALNFPSKHEVLFQAEAQSAATVLRAYAATNRQEYFAEYFAFWIKNRENETKMERLRTVSPETYAYFVSLEANNWIAG